MRFLHAADLHLGMRLSRFGDKNQQVQEARFTALDKIVETAKKHQPDFVLIAGDLFDDNHVDSTTSSRAYKILASIDKPVYVLPGNHDPLTVDSVYQRPPWCDDAHPRVRVLRTTTPVPLPAGVTLFPCPLYAKNSTSDPTQPILQRPPGDESIRIGVAHGSLNDRPNLSPDDHLIDRHAADAKGLDYLALGHWHSPYRAQDRAGIERTVYPGVHEPMCFQKCPEYSVGWTAYSSAASSGLFCDDGCGRVLLVTIDRCGARPLIEEIKTGRLQWLDETYELSSEEDLGNLIRVLANRAGQEGQLLRLHLKGTLPAAAMQQLDELAGSAAGELAGSAARKPGVLHRFHWFELDTSGLHIEPSEVELQELAGDGVLRTVYEQLRAIADNPAGKAEERETAREALLILYQLAREVRR